MNEIRSRNGLIIFMDIFMILLFVLAAQQFGQFPKIFWDENLPLNSGPLRVIKWIDGKAHIKQLEGPWESLEQIIELSRHRVERPLFLSCPLACDNIEAGLHKTGGVLVLPPLSDEISTKFFRRCLFDFRRCRDAIISVGPDYVVKLEVR